ncbi:MAG: tRNA 2-thiouridine(34) synthase MnmA [Clostridia bacterium]|nr:tRNA 2-thiouridine(34) synthase MnmA [Clostridia bacterium]
MCREYDYKKVILGLSGGVDSTAAALILQKQGYEVVGLYFNVLGCFCMNYEENINRGKTKAQETADRLGIRLIFKDLSEEFDRKVVEPFCNDYLHGRTPNPCIICNPEIKFKALIDAADEEGAYYIATGHYAGTWQDSESGLWYIKKAANSRKDQSYMLYRLGQDVISRLIMPLESYESKEEIRELARTCNTGNSEDKDSQEICFIDSSDTYIDFLKRKGYSAPEGDFTDSAGNVLGRHKGICAYTIGQRKGLGIALGRPAFVTEIDSENNRVVLGNNEDLFTCKVMSTGNILCKEVSEVTAKIRYTAPAAKANLTFDSRGIITAHFIEPQRASTPGQSIVFYDGDIVIGGGFIV